MTLENEPLGSGRDLVGVADLAADKRAPLNNGEVETGRRKQPLDIHVI